MVLEDHGYRVITAPDGVSGLRMASDERPDLVIVDMMMPRMSGFTVLERIKESSTLTMPVLMLTANESDEQRTFAHCLGVDAYLNKPIGTRQLIDHVQRLCPVSRPLTLSTARNPVESTV